MNLAVAIDVGNTNTDIGMVDLVRLKCIKRMTVASGSSTTALGAAIRKIAGKHLSQITSVGISTVDRARLKPLTATITKTTGLSCSAVHNHADLPIGIAYQNPSMLGADRIADALYAYTKYPRQNVIIIDSGTTITIDLLDKKGVFRGGAIIPGIFTQIRSLHANTAALPSIDSLDGKAVVPGSSTLECMVGGVKTGLTGSINAIVAAYQKQCKNTALVLACGGGWRYHESGKQFKCIVVPDLTLLGTAIFSECCPGNG